MRPPSPESTGCAGRGRATGLFWESPEVVRPWAGGRVRLPGSPQPCDSQLRNQKPLFIQSLANTLDMVQVDHYFWDENLRVWQSVSLNVQT